MNTDRYFFSFNPQFENIGDALINRELLHLLSANGIVIMDLSRTPDQFIRWMSPLRPSIKKSYSKTHFFLYFFYCWLKGERPWWVLHPGGHYVRSDISIKQYIKTRIYALLLHVLHFRGSRVLQLGVSYDKFGPRGESAIRALAKKIDVHIVRDRDTLSRCISINARVDGRLNDFAYALSPSLPITINENVIVSLRSLKDGSPPDISQIASAVPPKRLLFSWQVKRDALVAKKLRDQFSPESSLLPCLDSIDQNRDIYGSCKLVVTNRLHVFLLTLSAGGLPVLLLEEGQNQKIRGVVKDAHLEELIRSIDEIANLMDDDDHLDSMRKHAADRYLIAHKQFIAEAPQLIKNVTD